MRRDPRQFLWDARDAADAIAEFTEGKTFAEFTADRMLRSAVERQFEIVGEALNQLSKTHPEIAARIPELPRIVSFRNMLIHGYATLNHQTVWNVVAENLPELRQVLDALLRAHDPSAR